MSIYTFSKKIHTLFSKHKHHNKKLSAINKTKRSIEFEKRPLIIVDRLFKKIPPKNPLLYSLLKTLNTEYNQGGLRSSTIQKFLIQYEEYLNKLLDSKFKNDVMKIAFDIRDSFSYLGQAQVLRRSCSEDRANALRQFDISLKSQMKTKEWHENKTNKHSQKFRKGYGPFDLEMYQYISPYDPIYYPSKLHKTELAAKHSWCGYAEAKGTEYGTRMLGKIPKSNLGIVSHIIGLVADAFQLQSAFMNGKQSRLLRKEKHKYEKGTPAYKKYSVASKRAKRKSIIGFTRTFLNTGGDGSSIASYSLRFLRIVGAVGEFGAHLFGMFAAIFTFIGEPIAIGNTIIDIAEKDVKSLKKTNTNIKTLRAFSPVSENAVHIRDAIKAQLVRKRKHARLNLSGNTFQTVARTIFMVKAVLTITAFATIGAVFGAAFLSNPIGLSVLGLSIAGMGLYLIGAGIRRYVKSKSIKHSKLAYKNRRVKKQKKSQYHRLKKAVKGSFKKTPSSKVRKLKNDPIRLAEKVVYEIQHSIYDHELAFYMRWFGLTFKDPGNRRVSHEQFRFIVNKLRSDMVF